MISPKQKPLARKINRIDQTVERYPIFQPEYGIGAEAPETEFPNNNQSDCSFLHAIAPVATFFQIFALLPVSGIFQNDSKVLQFKWRSMRTLYTLAFIVYGVAITAFLLTYLAGMRFTSKNIG